MSHARPWQRGFTLVELLIASALGALVVLTAGEVLVMSRAIERADRAEAQQLDAVHLALTLMARSVRQAGYPGCHPAGRHSLISADDDLLQPVVSIRDGLTLRWMRREGHARVMEAPTRSDRLALDRRHGIAPGSPVMVANRRGPDCVVFRHAGDDPAVLNRGPGLNGINQRPARGYRPLGEAIEILVPARTEYYLDTAVGGGRLSLFRRRRANSGHREELVVGVESLSITAGIDTSGDGAVDRWVGDDADLSGATVAAVRMRLQAQSVDVATTAALRNNRP